MFCPKCGSQNAENVRFCRSCGTELEAVSAAMSGKLTLRNNNSRDGNEPSDDPDKLWNSFITKTLTGLAFIVIAIFLTVSGKMGGNVWGFWLLIPGAGALASGISSYAKIKRLEREQNRVNSNSTNAELPSSAANTALPPRQTLFANDYAAPAARETGELLTPPASVTEGTTRHLNISAEGETFNLPPQK